MLGILIALVGLAAWNAVKGPLPAPPAPAPAGLGLIPGAMGYLGISLSGPNNPTVYSTPGGAVRSSVDNPAVLSVYEGAMTTSLQALAVGTATATIVWKDSSGNQWTTTINVTVTP